MGVRKQVFQERSEPVVSWRSEKETVAITDHLAYPLEYAPPGMEQELRRRGQVSWTCRLRKFVDYDLPLQGMAVHKISSLGFDSALEIANTARPT
jgi:hypothetical protein